LKIKRFSLTPKPLQSHSKATPKTTPKHQTVENQALDKIFWSFGVHCKNISQEAPPLPYRPTSQSVGTIFARRSFSISIYLSITPKLQKQKQKINQIIERVRSEAFGVAFGVALEWLWSFLPLAKNYVITKPHQAPALAPPHHQTVEIQALHDTNQTLETQALDKVPSKLKNALRFF